MNAFILYIGSALCVAVDLFTGDRVLLPSGIVLSVIGLSVDFESLRKKKEW